MNNIFAYSKNFNPNQNNFPESYIDKIKSIPHVSDVNPCLQIFTFFENSTKIIGLWGILPEKLTEFMGITRVDGLAINALPQHRTAALVGNGLMEEYRWKIGDKIILKTGLNEKGIPFTIKGVVYGLTNASHLIYLNLRYLQNLLNNQGRVTFIYIKAEDSSYISEISKKVETLFRNYPVEIITITEKSFMDSIIHMIKAIIIAFRFIGWIAIISTFLLVANCIAISIRERTTEIGVMRVMGFSRTKILTLLLTESIVISIVGGMFGSLFAYFLITIQPITIPANIPLNVEPDIFLVFYSFLISFLVGCFGSILPSLNCVIKKPGDAIRNVG
jgi:putative ABC transport system permease protein